MIRPSLVLKSKSSFCSQETAVRENLFRDFAKNEESPASAYPISTETETGNGTARGDQRPSPTLREEGGKYLP